MNVFPRIGVLLFCSLIVIFSIGSQRGTDKSEALAPENDIEVTTIIGLVDDYNARQISRGFIHMAARDWVHSDQVFFLRNQKAPDDDHDRKEEKMYGDVIYKEVGGNPLYTALNFYAKHFHTDNVIIYSGTIGVPWADMSVFTKDFLCYPLAVEAGESESSCPSGVTRWKMTMVEELLRTHPYPLSDEAVFTAVSTSNTIDSSAPAQRVVFFDSVVDLDQYAYDHVYELSNIFNMSIVEGARELTKDVKITALPNFTIVPNHQCGNEQTFGTIMVQSAPMKRNRRDLYRAYFASIDVKDYYFISSAVQDSYQFDILKTESLEFDDIVVVDAVDGYKTLTNKTFYSMAFYYMYCKDRSPGMWKMDNDVIFTPRLLKKFIKDGEKWDRLPSIACSVGVIDGNYVFRGNMKGGYDWSYLSWPFKDHARQCSGPMYGLNKEAAISLLTAMQEYDWGGSRWINSDSINCNEDSLITGRLRGVAKIEDNQIRDVDIGAHHLAGKKDDEWLERSNQLLAEESFPLIDIKSTTTAALEIDSNETLDIAMKEELRQEMQEELRQEMQEELKKEMQEELKKEMQEELKKEMQEELKKEIQEEMEKEIQEEIKKEMQEELKKEMETEEINKDTQEEISEM